MALPSWTDISTSLLASGKAITTTLMNDIRDNLFANTDVVVADPRLDVTASVPTTYGAANGTYYLRVPQSGRYFDMRVKLWGASGTNYCKLRLALASDSSKYEETAEQSTTATAEPTTLGATGDKTYTFSSLHATPSGSGDLRGQECILSVYLRAGSGTVSVTARSVNWPQHRFRAE